VDNISNCLGHWKLHAGGFEVQVAAKDTSDCSVIPEVFSEQIQWKLIYIIFGGGGSYGNRNVYLCGDCLKNIHTNRDC
jgi:hypothetical protein